jgi:hypothetical protein
VGTVVSRIFDFTALVLIAGSAMAAFVAGILVGRVKGDDPGLPARGFEALVLALLGGLLSRAIVSLLLGAAHDSRGAGLAVGWGFLLYPGILDTIARIGGKHLLTEPGELMWFATVVGAFSGMMDGVWRIHRWEGVGVLSFFLDRTWGLGGMVNGSLLHVVNFAWAGHGNEVRSGAHRYLSGFRVKKDFAFTQGSVMSDLKEEPGDSLWRHEYTHVWQNRAFGPLFALSYIGWMVLLFIPGLIIGVSRPVGIGEGIQKLSYFNNPWEAWGYKVQEKHGGGLRSDWGALIWSDGAVVGASVLYFAAVLVVFVIIVGSVWF